ncbi:N-acyl homoserine lactonase family protein [Novosphingobium olei]|uniref:N-acyl homoserine lactonase family protein n=1 Tax=Novosphingobium olei TaxID=2728851 RepID=UPI003086FE4E|nr:N-acyl homoserine lactonase family protein [Novosphingobium olei]
MLKLYAFNCGWFQCKPSFLFEGETGPHMRAPVPAYLIDHPRGRAVFDTGIGRQFHRQRENALPPDKFGLEWFDGMEIAARLRALGIDPASVDWIINSHLHIDHCGGNHLLENATVIVQREELDHAMAGDLPGLYARTDYDTGQPFKAVRGEHDLFGDGTVRIVLTAGHTPGHQSVIVRLAGGDVLLAGDCCYTRRNLDLMALPPGTVDPATAQETLKRLMQMRRNGTRILFGHDGLQWKSVKESVPLSAADVPLDF